VIKRVFAFLLFLMGFLTSSAALYAQQDSLSVTEPVTYGGLTVWMVQAREKTHHPYLTLEDALSTHRAVIHENNSQTLWIENLSDTDLFVQSADLIKGGQQDRMVASDMIVPAHDTSYAFNVYCIEKGRSTKRGTEPIETFSSSEWMAPLAHTRIVARHELTEKLLTPKVGGLTAPDPEQLKLLESLGEIPRPFGQVDAAQYSIWNDVAVAQAGMTLALKDSVTRNQSPTSLELALDAKSVSERERDFNKRFNSLASDNTVGFIYAIGGKIRGGDIYSSHDLFNAMWSKLVRSASAEAIMDKSSKAESTISKDDVLAFIESAKHGKSTSENPNARTLVEAVRSDGAYRFVTYDTKYQEAPLHEEILARDSANDGVF